MTRQPHPLIERGFHWLILSLVGVHACMAVTRVSAALWLLHHGYGEWTVGVLMSLGAAGPVLLSLWAGRQADAHGLHRPLSIGAGMGLAGALLALAWPSPWTLAPAALLCGSAVGIMAVAIQREAGLMGEDAGELKRVFSWVALGPAFSNATAPVIAGLLIDAAGERAAFAFAALLPFVAWRLGRLVPRRPRRGHPAGAGGKPRAAWALLRLDGLRNLLMLNVVLTACWDAHSFVVPVVGHAKGLSASSIGLVLGAFATAAVVVRLVIARWAARLDEMVVLRSAMAIVATVLLVYAWLPGTPGLLVGSTVLGLALGSYQPMILSALHQVTPPDRHGQALGLRMLVSSGMSMTMPLGFGLLASSTVAFAPLWLMAGLALAAQWPAHRVRDALAR
ncbi:MFS transporter [Paucibacter sp. R3-3]|uniref:MFS transporter n=1 Tax=Roseateles agri TaxID=3098619 RepID=A0ABU5D9D2_9BURK|nr:MFS transporter [Paucibacter sp. R3-3]MDY0742880.1 MFS transporter [Paucibacter sp. R3-3]